MSKVIKLTEADLHRMIKESVNNVLNESFSQGYDNVWSMLDELKQCMSESDILARLVSRLDPKTVETILQEVMETECNF